MRGVFAKEVFCPRCREPHLAGTDTPSWAWFDCDELRFEIPENQKRLGSKLYRVAAEMGLDDETGCMGCGQTARCTRVSDGLVRYVCYRCGEVGLYGVILREEPFFPTEPLDVAASATPTPPQLTGARDLYMRRVQPVRPQVPGEAWWLRLARKLRVLVSWSQGVR